MKISKELIKGSTVMLVMSVLKKNDMYGYKIIKELELQSESVFELKEGTLYPILHALEKENLLESYWEEFDGRKTSGEEPPGATEPTAQVRNPAAVNRTVAQVAGAKNLSLTVASLFEVLCIAPVSVTIT